LLVDAVDSAKCGLYGLVDSVWLFTIYNPLSTILLSTCSTIHRYHSAYR